MQADKNGAALGNFMAEHGATDGGDGGSPGEVTFSTPGDAAAAAPAAKPAKKAKKAAAAAPAASAGGTIPIESGWVKPGLFSLIACFLLDLLFPEG